MKITVRLTRPPYTNSVSAQFLWRLHQLFREMKWASRPKVTGLNQCAEICSQPIWYFSNGCLKCSTQVCYKSHAVIILKESSVIWKLKSMEMHNKNNTHLDIYVKRKIICVTDIHNSYFCMFFSLCPFFSRDKF